ncbi:MAG TPA: hypothetical protein VF883_16845 [Thermoanaerobaculia bacterium]|jgi:hypothetical protein
MLEFLRVLLLLAAGVALFSLGRLAWSGDARMRLIVVAGFLGRAFVSQLLFWISYLSLPIAPALQSGNGLWFYAEDATYYTAEAAKTAAAGLDEIASIPVTSASPAYQQALALFSLLFGNPVSVSLLLNLFCYLGACAIIVRWSRTAPGSRNAALVALAAISLSPAGVLWSMQPLKDTFFQFLIVAFFGACFLWQRAWRAEQRMGRQLLWAGAALIASHYLLTGVRWYIGGFLFGAAALFMLLVPLTTIQPRRWLAAGSTVALLLILSRTYLFAAGPYLPPALRNVLEFQAAGNPIGSTLLATADNVRVGFEKTGGNTSIQAPKPKQRVKPQPKPEPPVAVAAAPPPAQQAVEPVKVAEAPVTKVAEKKKKKEPAATPKAAPAVAAKVEPKLAAPSAKPAPVTVAAKPVAPTPVAVKAPEPKPVLVEPPDLVPPAEATRFEKLVAGATAAAMPRSIATRLGLVQIGGGRHNLWWFVELDTIFFDVILLIALGLVIANLRGRAYRNPLFWLVVVVTVLNAAALLYTVTNFGTLFRLRMMIFTSLALIPLALVTAPARIASPATPHPVSSPAAPALLTPKENEG